MSQTSESARSHTAQDFIASQLSLEADAREALPYQFDSCTKPLGPLRQSVYACLTCTPPPATDLQQFTPAGVCYSCSISCHGEHDLVELFTRRDFVCDCGTTRYSNTSTPCTLRSDPQTGQKGATTGEEARRGNTYNQNFKGKFCGCGEIYDPEKEKGTMFQCLGLGTTSEGGCGEDWWHAECLMGLPRPRPQEYTNGNSNAVKGEGNQLGDAEDLPPPTGFPREDDFDHFICFKCVEAFPWIKRYAGSIGFLPALSVRSSTAASATPDNVGAGGSTLIGDDADTKKRKADDDVVGLLDDRKKPRVEALERSATNPDERTVPRHESLPTAPPGQISLFLKQDFRNHFCRCAECFPRLALHPQLLEEEESYEPPLSESDAAENEDRSIAGRSVNSGSLLDRGEAALSSMDRVRAIEGVMAYNHVRDKVKTFLQPFAESGQPVGAEDIKAYFAKLRGDEQAMRDAAASAVENGGTDHRKEQDGY